MEMAKLVMQRIEASKLGADASELEAMEARIKGMESQMELLIDAHRNKHSRA